MKEIMTENGAKLLFLLIALTHIASPSPVREEETEAEVREGRRFWGGECQVDQDCLSLSLSDVKLQVSVCQSSRDQCEPSAVLWVLAAFLAMLVILIGAVAALYFCNRQ